MLNQNAKLISGLFKINLTFQDQFFSLQYNISFSNDGVSNATKIIDYANCDAMTGIVFPAGIYYYDYNSVFNMFQIYIYDTDGNLISSFIEYDISLRIDPFCMINPNESQYEIVNGYNSGTKNVILKCTKSIKQGTIKIFINGNLIGKQVSFQVLPWKVKAIKSFLTSDFIIRGDSITFTMRLVDYFGNIVDNNVDVSTQIHVYLKNSRIDSKMKLKYKVEGSNYEVKTC